MSLYLETMKMYSYTDYVDSFRLFSQNTDLRIAVMWEMASCRIVDVYWLVIAFCCFHNFI
jgi:hypothetical protein